jgi:hypothetical protein
MNFGSSSSFLGLAMAERSITCAEISVTGERRMLRRVATFTFPADPTPDKPQALGQGLASFLRARRFSSSRAVVGVPAKWLLATQREVPPSDEEQAHAILRLQAERLAVAESGDMVFDYAGSPDPRAPARVLLTGMRRHQFDRIDAIMDAAGITVLAITPTALALASAMVGAADAPVLTLGRQGAEIVWQHAGIPRMLRHFSMTMANGQSAPALGALGCELQRAVALAPLNGSGGLGEMLLLDGVGFEQPDLDQLADRMGLPIRIGTGLESMGIGAEAAAFPAETVSLPRLVVEGQAMPAAALAAAAASRRRITPDFAHSRLAAPAKRRLDRMTTWGIVVGSILVVALVSLGVMVQQRSKTLRQLNQAYSAVEDEIKTAEQMVSRVNYARGFFDARPPVLDCLRELTLAFRDDEPIWASSLTLRDSGRGQMAGRTTDQRLVLALLDRLKKNPRFADVKVLEIREAGGRVREWSFSMGFTFSG